MIQRLYGIALAAMVAACATETPGGRSADAGSESDAMVADAAPRCNDEVAPCGAGLRCNPTTGRCEAVGCNADPMVCSPGTMCDRMSGRCVSSDAGMPTVDASNDVPTSGCGTVGDERFTCRSCFTGNCYQVCTMNGLSACMDLPVRSPDAGTDAMNDAVVALDVMMPTDIPAPMDVVPVDVSPTCGSGQTYCSGRCVDNIIFASDTMNCRTCGSACLARPNARVATCTMGTCGFTCDAGFADCDGDPANGCEVNTGADAMNCGRCGVQCSDTQVCTGGRCADRCPGSTFCVATRACVNTQFDNANCGRCGNACSLPNATATCNMGACVVAVCNTGFGDCNRTAIGCETNLNTSDANCGRCGNACAPGQTCNGSGRCVSVCPAGQIFCAGACVDISTDENNCGACGTVCSGGTVCLARACTGICPLGRQVCTAGGVVDACVDFATDLRHCGGCGRVCNPFGVNAAQCVAGSCGFNRCLLGLANCDGNDANGCEVDLYTNTNCGACGRTCPSRTNASSFCSFEQSCTFTCNSGFGNCDGNDANGCETNTRTSLAHCGGCGRACLTGRAHQIPTCLTGVCDYACESGFADCDGDPANGCEVDVRTDANNCGRCTTHLRSAACASGQVCSAGVCVTTGPSCGVSTTNCSGVCTNTQSDATNCGACGRVCATGQTCVSGVCSMVSCGAGFTPCSGACVDTQNDPMNCGSCGGRCAGGLVCSRGVCNLPDAGVDVTADVLTDAGTDSGGDTMIVDGSSLVLCGPGTMPRQVIIYPAASAALRCGGVGHAAAWGFIVGEPIGTGPGVIVEPIPQPFPRLPVPFYHGPANMAGALLSDGGLASPPPLVFTDTRDWDAGDYIDFTAICGAASPGVPTAGSAYLEGAGYWDTGTFASLGWRVVEGNLDRTAAVVIVNHKPRLTLVTSRCVPVP